MKLSDIIIPKYTLGEELISSISHGIGAGLSIAGLVIGLVSAAGQGDAWKIISMVIYGLTLILLYLFSCLYHSLKPNKGKKVFRVMDHCTIFLLIAGTYTPYTLVTLRGPWGWTLFGIVWGAAVIGIVLNAINLKKFAVFSMICYLAMGWVIILAFGPLREALAPEGIYLLLAGGICYTLGAIIFGIGSKIPYFHSLWHFFVLAGSIFHYFSVLFYVIQS